VGVDVDADDNVYLLTRAEPRVIVYDRAGRFLRSWGEELFTPRTHGLTVAPDGSVYVVDEGVHAVYRFSSTGEQLGDSRGDLYVAEVTDTFGSGPASSRAARTRSRSSPESRRAHLHQGVQCPLAPSCRRTARLSDWMH
jgi:hypothetical protein